MLARKISASSGTSAGSIGRSASFGMSAGGHRAISQVVPSLVSFSTTPIAASSSRMRSDSSKSLRLRAALRASIRADQSCPASIVRACIAVLTTGEAIQSDPTKSTPDQCRAARLQTFAPLAVAGSSASHEAQRSHSACSDRLHSASSSIGCKACSVSRSRRSRQHRTNDSSDLSASSSPSTVQSIGWR